MPTGSLTTDPGIDYAPLFDLERRRLLELLRSLDASRWALPSPCPGWSVLGLAAHLVGDDLSLVSWLRDDHRGTPAPDGLDEPGFITWLDELQMEWVHAARRLSPRLTIELLEWLGQRVTSTVAGQDPTAVTASVSWAADHPVPVWLDHARELSERWIHRQQLLQAVGHPSDLRTDLAVPVLDGLRWAYPHRLAAHPRPAGARILVEIVDDQAPATWQLTSDGSAWSFRSGAGSQTGAAGDGAVVAALRVSLDQAWRLLTNNHDPDRDGPLQLEGDPELTTVLRRTRAIIGAPI